MVAIIATITAKDGHADQMASALLDNCRIVRDAEPGCLFCHVTQSLDDPHVFKLLELYASQEALDAHRVAPHVAQLRAAVSPHLRGAPEAELLRALG